MLASLFFGSSPGSRDVVGPDLLSRGINLIRAVPSFLNIFGTRTYDHPAYLRYLDYIALALRTAIDKTAYKLTRDGKFASYTGRDVSIFVKNPTVIFNYPGSAVPSNIDAIKGRVNAVETTARGKPAL